MPFDDVIVPRRPMTSVPTGLDRPPWLQREPFVAHVARTVVVEHGAHLLRAADAEPERYQSQP